MITAEPVKSIQPVLDNFIERMQLLYGGLLHSIILYGSYARQDYDEDSDIDLLLLLTDLKVDPYEEIPRITELAYPLILKYHHILSYFPVSLRRWQTEESYFFDNVKRDGIVLWTKEQNES